MNDTQRKPKYNVYLNDNGSTGHDRICRSADSFKQAGDLFRAFIRMTMADHSRTMLVVRWDPRNTEYECHTEAERLYCAGPRGGVQRLV